MFSMSETINTSSFDEIDRKILLALQHDARISFAELGRSVGLTPTAVAERIRKLEERGVISGYQAQLSLAHLGYPITTFVQLRTDRWRDHELAVKTMEIPEVIACHSITGADCVLLKVVAASVEHLAKILEQLSDFGRTTTSVVLFSKEKQEVGAALLGGENGEQRSV